MRLVCCLVLVLGGLQLACALKVAAWNIQIFGQKKVNNPTILEYIAEVIREYDVIVIQEIRDSSPDLDVVNKLMKAVNDHHFLSDYDFQESELLGVSTRGKERYLYIYNHHTVDFHSRWSFQFPVLPVPKHFDRPPFVAKFHAKADLHRSFDFVMIPLHAKPNYAVTYKEINALEYVVEEVYQKWKKDIPILLLGDFNAGGAYLPAKKFKELITLNKTNGYTWLIDYSAVTTVVGKWPYDRIVATTSMMDHVVPGTAKVFDFTNKLDPSKNGVEAKDISDHFPVEVELKGHHYL